MASRRQLHAASLAALASACGVRADGPAAQEAARLQAGLWLDMLEPYGPEEVAAAITETIRTMDAAYGRLPMPSVVIDRIHAARARRAREESRRRTSAGARIRGLAESRRTAAGSALELALDAAAALPPSEAVKAAAAAHARHEAALRALAEWEADAAETPALEVHHAG